jgi:hypothetical protein
VAEPAAFMVAMMAAVSCLVDVTDCGIIPAYGA